MSKNIYKRWDISASSQVSNDNSVVLKNYFGSQIPVTIGGFQMEACPIGHS